VEVNIGRGTRARGVGRSKQEAAQAAASTALSTIRRKPDLAQ
jgi:dsRNA-specific ribonuclease